MSDDIKTNIERIRKEITANIKSGFYEMKDSDIEPTLKELEDFYIFCKEKYEQYNVKDFLFKNNSIILSFEVMFYNEPRIIIKSLDDVAIHGLDEEDDEENEDSIDTDRKFKDLDNGQYAYLKIDDANILVKKENIEQEHKSKLEESKVRTLLERLFYPFRNSDIGKIDLLKDKREILKSIVNKDNLTLIKVSNNSRDLDDINEFTELFFNTKIEYNEEEHKDKIIKVFEYDNIRIAIYYDKRNYADKDDFRIIIIKPEHYSYNYIDEKRFISQDNIFDFDLTREQYDYFTDNITRYRDRNRNEYRFISTRDVAKEIHNDKIQGKIREQKQEQEQETNENINKILSSEGKITLNGIERDKKGFFRYENQTIGFKGLQIGFVTNTENDFNKIFHDLIYRYFNHIHSGGSEKLSCGSFDIAITYASDRTYIEGVRINKKEVFEVIEKAICYTKLEDYKVFLKEVSKCSIKIHNILNEGLLVNFDDRYAEENQKKFTKINISRVKNKHFITLNGQNFPIHNLNAIVGYAEMQYNTKSVYGLVDRLTKQTDLDFDNATLCIKEGFTEFKNARIRAEELLKETITKLQIEQIDYEGKEYQGKGYLLTAKSGNKYFVTNDLKVYRYPEMRYICIINKNSVSSLNSIDLLVSRLYALYNDSVMVEQISTLTR